MTTRRAPGESNAPVARTEDPPAVPRGLLARDDDTDPVPAAILRSAGELLSRNSPSEVTLREIAAHAGVNYGLIHRHFGTKEALILRLFDAFAKYGASLMQDAESIYEAIAKAFEAESGAFAEILAWMILDRVEPDRLWGDLTVMHDAADRTASAWDEHTPLPPTRPVFDPRVVSTLAVLVISVWEFYAPYVATMGDYPDRDAADVKREVLELLQLMIAAATPHAG